MVYSHAVFTALAKTGHMYVTPLLYRAKEVTTPPESEQRTSLKDTHSTVCEQSPPKDLPPIADADGRTTTDNPSEGTTHVDGLGRSLDSLQLVESSVTAVDGQATVDTPVMVVESTSYPPSAMSVECTPVSSVAKLQHAMSVWCTPATLEHLRGGGGGGSGGGGVEEEEPPESPFLPPVHSVGQTQLQRSIFMQQLKRK